MNKLPKCPNSKKLFEEKFLNLFKLAMLKRFSKRTLEKLGVTNITCEYLQESINIIMTVNNSIIIYGKNNSKLKKLDEFIEQCKISVHKTIDLRIIEKNIWEIDKRILDFREYFFTVND